MWHLPRPGMEPALEADSLPLSRQGSPVSHVSLSQGFSGPLTCVVHQRVTVPAAFLKLFETVGYLCSGRLLRGCTVRNVVQELQLHEPAPDPGLSPRGPLVHPGHLPHQTRASLHAGPSCTRALFPTRPGPALHVGPSCTRALFLAPAG